MSVRSSRGFSSTSFIAVALAAAVACAAGWLVFAARADAYPTTVCSVSVQPVSLHLTGGQSLTVSGSSNVTTTWTVNVNGVIHHYTGTTFTLTYTTPRVSHRTVIGLTVTCTNSTGSKTLKFEIVVDPFAIPTGGNGHLPNTGGPSRWWLIAGLVLVVGGAGLMAERRRPQAQPVARHKHRR